MVFIVTYVTLVVGTLLSLGLTYVGYTLLQGGLFSIVLGVLFTVIGVLGGFKSAVPLILMTIALVQLLYLRNLIGVKLMKHTIEVIVTFTVAVLLVYLGYNLLTPGLAMVMKNIIGVLLIIFSLWVPVAIWDGISNKNKGCNHDKN